MANVIDIRSIDVSRINSNIAFALDTNILLWIYYTHIGHPALNRFVSEYQLDLYPSFIYDLIANGNTLYTTTLNISELCSVIERNEFEIFKYNCGNRNYGFKRYRKLLNERTNYKNLLDQVLNTVHLEFLGRIEVIEISTDFAHHFTSEMPTMLCDTFDFAVIEHLKSVGISNYISDDKDFISINNINLYTTYDESSRVYRRNPIITEPSDVTESSTVVASSTSSINNMNIF